MSLNNLGLGFLFTAQDAASGVVSKIGEGLKELDDTQEEVTKSFQQYMGDFAQGAATAAAGLAVLKGVWEFTEAAMPYEEAMIRVQLHTHATSEEMERVKGAVEDASKSVKEFSTNQIASAMQVLAQQTGSVDAAFKFLDPTLRFAALHHLDASATADTLTDTLAKLGYGAERTTEVTDKMTWAMNRYQFTGQEALQFMGQLGGVAAMTGASFDELTTIYGMAMSKGMSSGEAMGVLRMGLLRLQDDLTRTKLEEGLDISLAGKSSLEMLGAISGGLARAKAAGKDTGAVMYEAFGGRMAGNMSLIFSTLTDGVATETGEVLRNADAMEYLTEQLDGAAGATKEQYDQTRNSASALEGIKAAWDSLKVAIGEVFLPRVATALKGIATFAGWIRDAFSALPAPVREFFGVFVPVVGLVLTGVGAVKMLTSVVGMLKIGMKALGVTSKLAMGPWSLILAGVVALGVLVYENWEVIAEFFRNLWEEIVAGWEAVARAVETFVDDVVNFFVGIYDSVMGVLDDIALGWTLFWGEDVPNAIRAAWDAVKAAVAWLFRPVVDFFTKTIPDAVTSFATSVGEFFAPVADFIELITDGLNWLGDKLRGIADTILGIIGKVWDVLKDAWEWLSSSGGMSRVFEVAVKERQRRERGARAEAVETVISGVRGAGGVGAPGTSLGEASPAAAYLAAQTSRAGQPPPSPRGTARGEQQVIETAVTLNVDGEPVARTLARTQRHELARGFAPVPEET